MPGAGADGVGGTAASGGPLPGLAEVLWAQQALGPASRKAHVCTAPGGTAAGGGPAARHRGEGAVGCDGHGGGDAADACRRGVGGVNGGRHGPVAELTEVVLPPAEDGAIAGEGAGVKAAGSDGGGGDSSDRHRSEGSLSGDGRTELAGVVAPPALDRAVGKARARMEAAT